jgi:hypothetical protein
VAESLSTVERMVPAMALGLASARPRRTSCVEFSEASLTAIFVDSISHRRPPGQPVSANSRSRLDEHPMTLCGVMVIVAQYCQRRPETYSAILGYLAFGGHLRDPSSSPRSGRAFHHVAAFDYIILASWRLGRGALLVCHLISRWCFGCKCTALFSSASLLLCSTSLRCLTVAGRVAPGFFFSATPVDNVSCVMRRGRNLAQDLTRDFEFSVGAGRRGWFELSVACESGMLFCLLCRLSSRLGFFLSEY